MKFDHWIEQEVDRSYGDNFGAGGRSLEDRMTNACVETVKEGD